MTTLVVRPAEGPLVGSVPVPADPAIGHRALLLAALAEGTSRISGFTGGRDPRVTLACLRGLGVTIEEPSPHDVVVSGAGLFGLAATAATFDCGPSGTTMRLLLGLLAAQLFPTTVTADDEPAAPTLPVVVALRQRGAIVAGRPDPTRAGAITAPFTVEPLPRGHRLSRIEYESGAPNADVKTALLLSGLYAEGTTVFKEPTISRDHTERMLDALGVPIRTVGTIVELDPSTWNGRLPAFELAVPGDLSAAVFPLVAAQLVPDSRVTARGVGVNPTRAGWLEIARDMGAGLTIEPQGERHGEPVAALHAWCAPLRSASVGGETLSRALDEMPAACALAARSAGTSRFLFAPEPSLRDVGTSDERRLSASTVRLLRAFGVACTERPGALEIEGRAEPLDATEVDSGGDARIAMTATVLALVARGPTRVRNAGCITASFPKFVATLRALGARIDVEA